MRASRKPNAISQNRGEVQQRAFTLIELIVVVAIAGILAAIAYPSYVQYTVKSKRKAAESFMLTVANSEEKYVLDARQYAYDTTACDQTAVNTLGLAVPANVSANYTICIASNPSVTLGYIITAKPIGNQKTGDVQCQNLILDQAGTQTISVTGSAAACW